MPATSFFISPLSTVTASAAVFFVESATLASPLSSYIILPEGAVIWPLGHCVVPPVVPFGGTLIASGVLAEIGVICANPVLLKRESDRLIKNTDKTKANRSLFMILKK